jgi:hypothetical protein
MYDLHVLRTRWILEKKDLHAVKIYKGLDIHIGQVPWIIESFNVSDAW